MRTGRGVADGRPVSPELILLPSLKALPGPAGGRVLTRKFLEGAGQLARYWPGHVTALIAMTRATSTEFDLVEVTGGESHGVRLEDRPGSDADLLRRLQGAAVVLGFASRDQLPLAPACRAAGIPLVYLTEYAPETERQIMRANTPQALRRMRRLFWLWRTDRMRRRALRLAAGMQNSGTPTHDTYRALQPNALLFFDNRLYSGEILGEEACRAKAAGLAGGRPLRLVFGGRFVPMKGVMDLPEIAAALRRSGTGFTLDIYGDGPMRTALSDRIRSLGLDAQVRLRAPLDFRSGWVRVLREEADLFVCCHIQGDPSSTYPEVMSCGVPIAGYDNAAFRGIMRESGTGWSAPIRRPAALAARIAELDRDRGRLAASVAKGRAFGLEHAFEATFRARAEHLARTAGL